MFVEHALHSPCWTGLCSKRFSRSISFKQTRWGRVFHDYHFHTVSDSQLAQVYVLCISVGNHWIPAWCVDTSPFRGNAISSHSPGLEVGAAQWQNTCLALGQGVLGCYQFLFLGYFSGQNLEISLFKIGFLCFEKRLVELRLALNLGCGGSWL